MNRWLPLVTKSPFPEALIVLLGSFLRLGGTATLRLWGDGGHSVYLASRSLPYIVSYAPGDGQPPLYYFLLHFWLSATGSSELAIRWLSMAPSLLSIALAFKLGERLLGRGVGILGSFFVALSPSLVYFGRLPRMYSLAICLALLSAYLFLKAVHRPTEVGLWTAFGAATLAAFYTHYYVALIILVEDAYLLIYWRQFRHLWPKIALVHIILAVLYIPWLAYTLIPSLTHATGVLSLSSPLLYPFAFIESFWAAFNLGILVEPLRMRWASLLLLAVWVVSLAMLTRSKGIKRLEPTAVFILLFVLIPTVVSSLISLRFPYFRARFMVFVVPVYLLALAWAIGQIDRRWLALSCLGGVVAVMAYGLSQTYFIERNSFEVDTIQLTEYIQRLASPKDVVIFQAQWKLGYFQSHYQGKLPRTVSLRELNESTAASAIAGSPKVWLAMHGVSEQDPNYPVQGWLTRAAYKADQVWFGDSRLSLFATPSTEPSTHPLLTRFDNGVELLEVGVEPALLHPKDTLHLVLQWRRQGDNPERTMVFVHLIDSQGMSRAGRDAELAEGQRPLNTWVRGEVVEEKRGVLIPDYLPPGEYKVAIGLYRLSDGSRVLTQEGNDRVIIGSVQVGETEDVSPAHRTAASFGDRFELLGYTLDTDSFKLGRAIQASTVEGTITLYLPAKGYRAGDSLEITLYWQALQPVTEDYVVFINLVDGEGRARIEHATMPIRGSYPTSHWKPGNTIVDPHTIPIDSSIAPGDYHLEVGLYLPEKRERLEARSKAGQELGDRLRLDNLLIEGKKEG